MFPFSKPRFIIENTQLKLINTPLQNPQQLFSVGRVSELPYLKYDPGFNPADWEQHFYHKSYLARLFVSKFPKWPNPIPETSNQALTSINNAIITSFTKDAKKNGSIPVVIYFPSRGAGELSDDIKLSSSKRFAQEILNTASGEHIDLTKCVKEVEYSKRFAFDGNHYSATANKKVAHCLTGYLEKEVLRQEQ